MFKLSAGKVGTLNVQHLLCIDFLVLPRTLLFFFYFLTLSRAFSHNFLLIVTRPLNSKFGIWVMVPLSAFYQDGQLREIISMFSK